MFLTTITAHRPQKGFSLIEVAFSMAIIGFGLVAIFGLFATNLRSNKDVVDQQESYAVVQATSAYLKEQGFTKIYPLIKSKSIPDLYVYRLGVDYTSGDAKGAYTSSNVLKVRDATDPELGDEVKNRAGRLFLVKLKLSPNLPIPKSGSDTEWIAEPTEEDLPAIESYQGSCLALTAKIYAVPEVIEPPQRTVTKLMFSVVTFDLTISR